MTSAPQNTVELSASLRLVAPDAAALAVAATLIYRLDDLIAVGVVFNPLAPGDESVTWWFTRDLLVNGLDHEIAKETSLSARGRLHAATTSRWPFLAGCQRPV